MNSNNATHIKPGMACHVTCVVSGLLPLFSQPPVSEIVFDCWRQLRRDYAMRLYSYVVMEEHLHFLVDADRLDECVSYFLEQSGSRIFSYLQEQRLQRFTERLQGKLIWQEKPEMEAVADSDMRRVIDYIHINPVKRGYVDDVCHWRYTSARNYAGIPGVTEVDLWRS